MVLRADVLLKAILRAKGKGLRAKSKVVLLTPQGAKFNQKMAQRLSKYDQLVFVCGRYEGFDERIRGDHHIFTNDKVVEIVNLQPTGAKAKPYQVKQVRNLMVRYKLGGFSLD